MSGSANTHARKSPSDSKRWMNCTASLAYEEMFSLATRKTRLTSDQQVRLNDLLVRFDTEYGDALSSGYKADETSEYADEGTRAHDWAELILLGKATIGEVPEAKDMRKAVASYIEECHRLEGEGSEMGMFVEEKVPLFYDLDSTGTMDFGVVSKERVRLRDYKHGAGMYVEAKENSQIAIYALSFMRFLEDEGYYKFEPDTIVEIGIWQPRHRQWDPAHLWIVTYHDLQAFGREIEKKAAIADSDKGVFAPADDVCQWCKLKAFCGARRHMLLADMPTNDGEDNVDFLMDLPSFAERGSEGKFEKELPTALERLDHYTMSYPPLTDAQMVRIFQNKKGIEKFVADIAKYLTQRAKDGDPVEGTKLVVGQMGNRAWASDAAAEEFLMMADVSDEDMFKKTLISVTDAEKLLGDKVESKKKKNPLRDESLIAAFKEVVTRSPGQPVLALASDSRDSATVNLDDFDDIDNDDYIED